MLPKKKHSFVSNPTFKMNSTTSVKQLAKQTLAVNPQVKPVTMVKETVTLADGSTLNPLPVKNSSDALRASLLMLFKHVADVHVTVVEIVAEKFNLKVEDIHQAIQEDPRWTELLVNPLITDLTAAAEEHAVKPVPKKKKAIVVSDEDELVFD
jgi:hypothetical protein